MMMNVVRCTGFMVSDCCSACNAMQLISAIARRSYIKYCHSELVEESCNKKLSVPIFEIPR